MREAGAASRWRPRRSPPPAADRAGRARPRRRPPARRRRPGRQAGRRFSGVELRNLGLVVVLIVLVVIGTVTSDNFLTVRQRRRNILVSSLGRSASSRSA